MKSDASPSHLENGGMLAVGNSSHSTSAAADATSMSRPLFVDLDGTLIGTDLLHEGTVRAVRQTPSLCFQIPKWLSAGIEVLKCELADRAPLDAANLPYHESLLKLLAAEQGRGRPIVLATASPEKWAHAVAEHLGLFVDVIATDRTANRKSSEKLKAMREWCERKGFTEFDYVGDSAADCRIWAEARVAYLVGSGTRFESDLRAQGVECQLIGVKSASWKTYVKALRPHQWAKNVLVFAPMLLSHAFADVSRLFASSMAFIAFSLCASAVYVLNDLLDIDNDRKHPTKCRRPLAAGLIPIPNALAITAGLLIGAIGITTFLPGAFAAALAVYFVITTAYSIWLKRMPLVDVFCLAGLYTSRLIAGGLATGNPVSEWLMTLSVFLFTSLAFAKRYSELSRLEGEEGVSASGRGYLVSDISIIETLGPTCGYLAVLVFALYINSDAVSRVYKIDWPLWAMCPLLMYWITRVWFLAKRKILSEDPVIFAIKDNVSRAIAVMVGLLFVISVVASKVQS